MWFQLAKKARVYDGTAWQELASAQTDLTAYSTTAQTTAGFRNVVINGGFDIWQRGTSFTQTNFNAGNIYTADRTCMIWNNVPTSVTVSQQTFTPGAAPVAGYEGTFFFRSTITTVGTNTIWGYSQRIEDVRDFAGRTATISFWAKADTPRNVTVELNQVFGSGGSSTVVVTNTAIAITSSWVRYTLTVNIPSISGKTVGTNSYLALNILQASASGSVLDIWGVQLEAGSVATPFEQRPIGTELALCQRYYYRISSFGSSRYGSGYAKTSTTADIIVDFPVTMRVAPTALEQSGTASDYLIAYQNSAVAGSSVPTFVGATLKAGVVNFNVGAVLTAGNGVMGGPNGANNYLGFSAEL
jgi:hypothetical protein